MFSAYFFFLAVRITCTICAGYFRFRLAMFKNTNTAANVCFLFGYVLALCAQVIAIHDSEGTILLLRSYTNWHFLVKQILQSGVFIFFLAGTLKTYVIFKAQNDRLK